ncbi:PREDICTED: stress-activated map kinase-interacting protein 1-like [Rhagoletis zephyria]|uniref:stress-activated map kinase-interacting protein 1-like n=1 Tax=Rhagoletis zephyria TaxID=28612 RepID=UPI000811AAC2|nr:PREDICTED: stress-activated map kinase-interacting protein 1-like [Rhagoletis zephyria]XP_017478153.1 PREDICTED: stress-activated map kinase-interacting protein 1-like [Rhagoletis zephyria]
MATYCNQHWLLSHIRNSFISTDDTGMCETVMLSDDMPKHFLQKYHTTAVENNISNQNRQQNRKSIGNKQQFQRMLDPALQEVDFVCYPGLDQSDDEDMNLTTQSYEIKMYPEIGAHRFRSNTAQKLEKMDIARRKAAKTKSVNYDDEIVPPERIDFFVKKSVSQATIQNATKENIGKGTDVTDDARGGEKCEPKIKSKLAQQLANSPKQAQNKFMEYACFDGTSQTGIQTKRIHVFLSMLPERERNYPIKICVLASAKIIEVIGLVCYKATIQYPDIPLKSIRHYALYITEDNDDMEDFPPLDNREPCSKFGFSHLTLAERRPLAQVTRIEYSNNMATKSMTSEEDKARLAAAAVQSLQGITLNGVGDGEEDDTNYITVSNNDDYEERMMSHNDMLEAPMYRTYRLNIIDKPFFKTEVTLGISGERIEIDQHKNAKFWTKQKSVTYPIDVIASCEIVERRHLKATIRIWLKSSSSSSSANSSKTSADMKTAAHTSESEVTGGAVAPHSPTSPGHYLHVHSPFGLFSSSSGSAGSTTSHHYSHMRFKHYDFEADTHTAEHILNKLNCILKVRSSEVRREFLQSRQRKLEKNQAKKHLKM